MEMSALLVSLLWLCCVRSRSVLLAGLLKGWSVESSQSGLAANVLGKVPALRSSCSRCAGGFFGDVVGEAARLLAIPRPVVASCIIGLVPAQLSLRDLFNPLEEKGVFKYWTQCQYSTGHKADIVPATRLVPRFWY